MFLAEGNRVLNNLANVKIEEIDRDYFLAQETLKGGIDAFNEIFTRHHKMVAALVFKIVRNHADTQDLVQKTFIKAYDNLNQYQNRGNFRSWIGMIARNTALDKLRKDKAVKNLDNKTENLDERIDIISEVPCPSTALRQKEFSFAFKQALAGIPDTLAEPFVMAVLDKTPYQTIADELGISLENVKIRIFRARKEMTKLLSNHMKEERS